MVLASSAAASAAAPAPAPVPPPPVKHPLTPADVEAFLDGIVSLQLETEDIAGATVSIVKDGKLLLAKGYGYADMKTRAPVLAESTMFRVGSISKLTVWTAVMQLVEQGVLDLDADVNAYLDFKIPATFAKPVTLRHLMTHRGGFEETLKALGAQNKGTVDLAKYLHDHLPAQLFEPGTLPGYSNYGAALAGYVVQRVSGSPFETYAEDNIFKPLGMKYSTLRQPLPKDLAPHMSSGYRLASDDAMPFEIINAYPAGSQSSGAVDIAKFMVAHLSEGALANARILRPETVTLMHDTVTALDPRQNGSALGFYEQSRNGLRIISHGGDTIAFHSALYLIPSEKLGFFVSYNSAGRDNTSPRAGLWLSFLDRYYPHVPPPAAALKDKSIGEAVAGQYITTRRAESTLLRMMSIASPAIVTVNDDGTIECSLLLGLNGKPRKWEPLSKTEFRDVRGQDKLIFKPDRDGTMLMLTSGAGVGVLQRAEGLLSPLTLLIVFGAAAGVLALSLISWPVAAFARWRYGASLGWTASDHALRFAVLLTAAALLTFVFGLLTVFTVGVNDIWSMDEKQDETFHLFQQIGIGGAVGTLIVIWNAWQSWTNPARNFIGSLKETAIALSCVVIVLFAWTMNWFDMALRY